MKKKCSFIGCKVQLIETQDPYTKLKPGDFGIIINIDENGTVFSQWDNGSTLGLIPSIDKFRIIMI